MRSKSVSRSSTGESAAAASRSQTPRRADSDEPEDDEAEAEAEPSPEDAHDAEHGEPDQAPVDEADTDEPSSEQGSDGTAAGSPSDAMQIVKQAREHLKNLLGADAESVSGIERTNGNWSVTFEVVEMRRIPESTDILSSYSAVLDDDGGIVSLTRGRRYRRSQVEEG